MSNGKAITLSIVAAIALLWAGGSIYGQISQQTSGLPPKDGGGFRENQPPPPGEERRERGRRGEGPMFSQEERKKMAEEIGLSEEQQKKIEAIREEAMAKGPEGFRDMFQKMEAEMTPEQAAKAREVMGRNMRGGMERGMQRRLEQAKKTMSPAEFKQFEELLNKRREQMRSGQFPQMPGMPSREEMERRRAERRGGNGGERRGS